jgi:hypothetical protein
MGSLATHGETPSVPQSPVTANIHQTFDGQLDFFAKISFDPAFILNNGADASRFFFA